MLDSHEFVITSDFNFHVEVPSNSDARKFFDLLKIPISISDPGLVDLAILSLFPTSTFSKFNGRESW
ncbi:unnamed protein product [Clavelina lepadiformis]|uniref:Endonuclease/exonuclease/phosphatase domain-containing protein n=1 Tax=Clavelina lepadiformis TaxID=159417 RepID=A0ABP0GHH1_CLALP